MKFRKKPVVIEAVTVNQALVAAKGNWALLPHWLSDAYEEGDVLFTTKEVLISTLEGKMTATSGDWIIQGVKGEIYPCRGDIFEATHERVTNE